MRCAKSIIITKETKMADKPKPMSDEKWKEIRHYLEMPQLPFIPGHMRKAIVEEIDRLRAEAEYQEVKK